MTPRIRRPDPGHLRPTTKRVAVAAAIYRGEVHGYAWTDRAWWRRLGPLGAVDEQVVTRWVNDLIAHGLAELPPGELPSDRITLRLTPAGITWWRRQDGRRTTTATTTGGVL